MSLPSFVFFSVCFRHYVGHAFLRGWPCGSCWLPQALVGLDWRASLWVNTRRFSKASGAAAPERIAAEPTSNGRYSPDSSRSWAGRQPAGKCREEAFAVQSISPAIWHLDTDGGTVHSIISGQLPVPPPGTISAAAAAGEQAGSDDVRGIC